VWQTPRSLDDVRGRAAKILPGSDPTRSEQNPDEKAAFLALIDEARIRAGLSQKEMAMTAAVSEGVFSEALKGQRGNFAIHWLATQPAPFWAAFLKILARRFDITPEREIDLAADRIGELVALLVKNTRRTA
jgi:transcriptional regulator with XRE-family HTH domain